MSILLHKGIILICCIALVIVAGCTSPPPGVDTPHPSPIPLSSLTPTAPPGGIFGNWSASFGGGVCIMDISPAGTVRQHLIGVDSQRGALWDVDSSGRYILSKDMFVRDQSPLVYDDIADIIVDHQGIVWERVRWDDKTNV